LGQHLGGWNVAGKRKRRVVIGQTDERRRPVRSESFRLFEHDPRPLELFALEMKTAAQVSLVGSLIDLRAVFETASFAAFEVGFDRPGDRECDFSLQFRELAEATMIVPREEQIA